MLFVFFSLTERVKIVPNYTYILPFIRGNNRNYKRKQKRGRKLKVQINEKSYLDIPHYIFDDVSISRNNQVEALNPIQNPNLDPPLHLASNPSSNPI